jgi:hypothetical protein
MPLNVDWYLPYRVIDVRLSGEVTQAEMSRMASEFVRMLTEVQLHAPSSKPYLLCDTLEAVSVPPLYLMLKDALPVLRFKNRGPMFHVTNNRSMRSMIQLTAHITQFQLFSFETRAEALRVLDAALLKEQLPGRVQ